MGVKVEASEIIIKFIIYYLIVSSNCDIKFITCDIHRMIQSYYSNNSSRNISSLMDINESLDFKINVTELEQHIMNGLNMKTKPDIQLANISQEEYFTKYNEYLNKVNSRKKRSKKLYGDITHTVFDDDEDGEALKKIFAFKYSNQSNSSANKRRRRRSTVDEDVTMLSFEINSKKDLPTMIEEAVLNVFLTNSKEFTSSVPVTNSRSSESDDDDSSSSSSHDISSKKFTLKSNRNSHKSHQPVHIRHSDSKHHSNRHKVHFISNSHTIKLHVYQHEPHEGRTFLFSKDITLPINSNTDDKRNDFSRWVQLDLTSIVRTWLQGSEKELNIDIHCEMCSKFGIYIVNEASQSNKYSSTDAFTNNPALNVIGAVVRSKRKAHNKKGKTGDAVAHQKHRKTHCRQNGEKKCCRHKWTIDFKELGGYEYIIQPRHFDAGFCDGTCPFRHNMGSNHAYFQSLAHHQLKKEDVPNVCCAPTRLQDLEILHIDENDDTKLKVTTMKKMLAMKCSCM